MLTNANKNNEVIYFHLPSGDFGRSGRYWVKAKEINKCGYVNSTNQNFFSPKWPPWTSFSIYEIKCVSKPYEFLQKTSAVKGSFNCSNARETIQKIISTISFWILYLNPYDSFQWWHECRIFMDIHIFIFVNPQKSTL